MAEASSGAGAVEKARTLEPDVVIMDLAMPGMDGVQATRRISALDLDTRVLVLTVHDEDEFLLPALDAGTAGFLNKSVADTDLMGAIEAIMRGHSYLPRRAAALMARRKTQGASSRKPGPEVLSARERTVYRVECAGVFGLRGGRGDVSQPEDRRGLPRPGQDQARAAHSRRDIVRFALETGLLRPEGDA